MSSLTFQVYLKETFTAQNEEEPPAHFKKRFCLFLTLEKVTIVLKTF